MACVLIARLFNLQIVNGQYYAESFTVKTTKTRTLKATRGEIYDCNGKLLAYNELSNSVTIEDNESYDSTREKNLSLNGEIYRLIELIRDNGDTPSHDFHIILDGNGEFTFDTDNETTINRFRADVYGYQTIDELKEGEKNASAEQIMTYLESSSRFGLVDDEDPYTAEELEEHGLPEELTNQEQLDIVVVRYQLNLVSYQRYVSVTVATDVNEETVAAVKENSDTLPGVEISEDYIRKYNNAESMAPIIGYTGKPSADELEELQKEDDKYTSSSIVGKAGIEQYMETTLQGTDGSEEVTVDNLGRVVSENEESRVDPVQGNDVYLTIDSDLQQACYQILEQRIAEIVIKHIKDEKTETLADGEDNDDLDIPSYDVYNALIENNVIDISHFSDSEASDSEKKLYSALQKRGKEVISWLDEQLTGDGDTVYKDLSEEEQAYVTSVCNDFLTSEEGIIDSSLVDTSDETYQNFTVDGTVSLRDYLMYAINQNWIDLTKLGSDEQYVTADEIYQKIAEIIDDRLLECEAFDKVIYKYLLLNDTIVPDDIINILYDQGILDKNDDVYQSFSEGKTSAYDLIIQKLSNLEITPAQLALDPCSGSIVLTDPQTGQVKACVTYPGYDNNRLSNDMDTDYYNALNTDGSSPFYNKATQQLTAPGSTFKPIMAAAGLTEGVINGSTLINCTGKFGVGLVDEGDQISCWYHSGHGELNVAGGITNSCNVFFCTVGYRLGLDTEDNYDSNTALTKIRKYAAMFGLDQESGIEINESSPHISDELPLPSSIGQGTHQYTTSQLARYITAVANRGTVYDLSLIQKTTTPSGKTLEEYVPETVNTLSFNSSTWDLIFEGMHGVITNSTTFSGFSSDVTVYGKTGTAQESLDRPDHALMVGFSQSKDSSEPDLAFSVRVAYGYSSTNAQRIVKDVLNYYYGLTDAEDILTGKVDVSSQYTESSEE